MTNEKKDAALVARAKAGDPEGLNDLTRHYWRSAYTSARKVLRSHEDAEDIAQEALLSAVLHLPMFDERSSFATWLHRIVINQSLMLLRRKRSCALDGACALDEQIHVPGFQRQPSPETQILDAERHHLLSTAIEKLPGNYRVPLWLFTCKEESVSHIAQNLQLSPDGVKIRLHRARKLVSRKVAHLSRRHLTRLDAAA